MTTFFSLKMKCQVDTGELHSCFLISFTTQCYNARPGDQVTPCKGCVIRKDAPQAKKEAEEKAKKEAAAAQSKKEAEEKARREAAAAQAKKEAEEKVKKEAAAAQVKKEAEEIAKKAAAAAAQAKAAEDQAKVCLVFPHFVFGPNLVLTGNSGHLDGQFWGCRLVLCS